MLVERSVVNEFVSRIEESVAVLPTIESEREIKIILGQRADNKMWMPVGGSVEEEDAFPLDALKREWSEETGSSLHDCIQLSGRQRLLVYPANDPTHWGYLYYGRFIGSELPQPKEGSELIRLKAFGPEEIYLLLKHYETSLYRPDLNHRVLVMWAFSMSDEFYLNTGKRSKYDNSLEKF